MPGGSKIVLIRQMIEAARNNLETATQLLRDMGGVDSISAPGTKGAVVSQAHALGSVQRTPQGAVIIEGVFDGQNMVGPDGKLYSVPANYASKSKLVEGDLLKLTISPDGSFIYKQIGPVERERLVGILTHDEQADDFRVLVRGKYYRILLASMTYFKADIADEVVVLVPKGTPSSWAAVENVIKKNITSTAMPEPGAANALVPAESVGESVTSAPTPRPRRTYTRKVAAAVPAETAPDTLATAPAPTVDLPTVPTPPPDQLQI